LGKDEREVKVTRYLSRVPGEGLPVARSGMTDALSLMIREVLSPRLVALADR
jgi:hypothetical protein